MHLVRFKASVWSLLFLTKENGSHCVVWLLGLAKRVGARLLLASTSEVYGGKKKCLPSVLYISRLNWFLPIILWANGELHGLPYLCVICMMGSMLFQINIVWKLNPLAEIFLNCLCSRSRGTPTKWGVLGAREPNWSSSMLRWGETCGRDHVLRLHETGIITVKTLQYSNVILVTVWLSLLKYLRTTLQVCKFNHLPKIRNT